MLIIQITVFEELILDRSNFHKLNVSHFLLIYYYNFDWVIQLSPILYLIIHNCTEILCMSI